MVEIDPATEIEVAALKVLVRACLENGRVVIPKSHATARMDERHITAVEVEACLRSGALRSDGLHPRGWRYRAESSPRGGCHEEVP